MIKLLASWLTISGWDKAISRLGLFQTIYTLSCFILASVIWHLLPVPKYDGWNVLAMMAIMGFWFIISAMLFGELQWRLYLQNHHFQNHPHS